MKDYDCIVVGAGLFGATVAHELHKKGKRVLVLEKRAHIGGNIHTEKIEGIDVHRYGAHIFHTDKKAVWEYVNALTPFTPYIHSPLANYKDTLYPLPFNMHTFNRMWGVNTPNEAHEKINEQIEKAGIADPQNLEEKALSLVGEDIYHSLIKGYTEKQWGRSAKDLPPFIIERLPLRFVFDNNYFKDRYQGIPEHGYDALIEAMLKGAEVRLDTDFFDHKEYYESLEVPILYTGMIDALYGYRFGTLHYRSLSFETTVHDTPNLQGVAVMNYTDRHVPYTRIIEHKHFKKHTQTPKTVVTKEYSKEYSKEYEVGMEPYYPINDKTNNERYAKYKALNENDPLYIVGGRLGNYAYYDMDDTIEEAWKYVNYILKRG